MITDMNARVAMAQKLSIPQLQQAIKNGTIPAYVGVPLLQDKMRQQQQMQMAAAQQQQGQQQQRPIADEVMDQAYEMSGGVDQLPSNLPIQNEEDDENYAGGGIIAFAEPTAQNNNSRVTDPDRRSPTDRGLDELIARINSSANNNVVIPPAANTGIAGVAPEVFSVDGVSPEFGGSSITADQDAERVAKIQAERTAAEDAQRQAFLRTAAPQMVRPEAPAQEPETIGEQGLRAIQFARDRGAPPSSATSSGAVSPDVARQISATNPGAPASLDAAERQAANGSPQASAAVSMLDKYVAMLEKSGDDVGRQKKEALYMALIQGGLGMMGGTSPNAFANISAGLLPATQAYQQAIAGIRKDDRARLEKLLSAGLKKEEFLLKAKEIGINQQKADNWYEVMRERNAAMAARGSGSDDIKTANAIRGLDSQLSTNLARVDAQIRNLNSANPMMAAYVNKSPDQIPKGIRDQVTAYSTQLRKLEGEKNRWINLHSSRVQSLGGVTLGDIEGDSASGVLSMPKSKGELKTGSVYNTARGPAKWDGNQFVSVK